MRFSIKWKQFANELPPPWLPMVIEEDPPEDPREGQGNKGQRIAIGSHMVEQSSVRPPPIGPRTAAVQAIGIVMLLASRVAVAFRSIH